MFCLESRRFRVSHIMGNKGSRQGPQIIWEHRFQKIWPRLNLREMEGNNGKITGNADIRDAKIFTSSMYVLDSKVRSKILIKDHLEHYRLSGR